MGAKIAVAGIIVILLGAVIGFVIYSDDILEGDDVVKYNYSIELGDSFKGGKTTYYPSSDNSQFAFVKFRILNISYETGFSTDYFEPYLIVNGLMYEESATNTNRYGDYESVKIAEGGYYTFTMVFEVPENTTVSGMSVQPRYASLSLENPLDSPNFKYSKNLEVSASIIEDDLVKYYYSIELGNSILYYLNGEPSMGMEYALVTFWFENVNYENGFYSSYFNPELIVDGIEYNVLTLKTHNLFQYDPFKIDVGEIGGYTLVYEVPNKADVNDMWILTNYSAITVPNMVFDNTLRTK